MKPLLIAIFFFASISNFASAQSELPVLEEYSFDFGDSGIQEFLFHDPSIGRGAAQLRTRMVRTGNETDLRIEVFRHHREGTISFALLLEKIEVTFVGQENNTLKKITLDNVLGPTGLFIIGDSNDGFFQHQTRIAGVINARRVEIRLSGNYE